MFIYRRGVVAKNKTRRREKHKWNEIEEERKFTIFSLCESFGFNNEKSEQDYSKEKKKKGEKIMY